MRTAARVLAVYLLAGCGGALSAPSGSTAEPNDAASDATQTAPSPSSSPSSAPSSPPSLGPIGDAGAPPPPSPCPLSLPAAHTGCSTTFACEYGANAEGACATLATCGLAGEDGPLWWGITPPPAGCGTVDPKCPPSFGNQGNYCWTSGICDYPEGRCGCSPCAMQADAGIWMCERWKTGGPGCPTPRPLLGTPCTPGQQGLACDYEFSCSGIPDMGPGMICANGTWVQHTATPPCPPPPCEGPPRRIAPEDRAGAHLSIRG
jgi:hypothetical protein